MRRATHPYPTIDAVPLQMTGDAFDHRQVLLELSLVCADKHHDGRLRLFQQWQRVIQGAVRLASGQVRWLLDKCGWGAVVAGALRAAKSSSMSSRTALS